MIRPRKGMLPVLAATLAIAASCQHTTKPLTSPGTPTGAATTATSSAADLTGTWSGPWSRTAPVVANGSNTFVLNQQGQSLSGTIQVIGASCLGTGTVTGSINGTTVTLHAETPAVTGGGKATADFTGALSGNTISGSFVGGCSIGVGTGTWAATKK